MKKHSVHHHVVRVAAVLAAGFLTLGFAEAGGFKDLDETEDLLNGQKVEIQSDLSKSGDKLDKEFVQFRSDVLEDAEFRCSIRANNTGIPLILRMLGADGGEVTQCLALPGGTCNSSYVMLAKRTKYHCLVSTPGGVFTSGNYRMAVQKR